MAAVTQFNLLSIDTPLGLLLGRVNDELKETLDYWINQRGHREFYCHGCRKLITLTKGLINMNIGAAVIGLNAETLIKASMVACSDECLVLCLRKAKSIEGTRQIVKMYELLYPVFV